MTLPPTCSPNSTSKPGRATPLAGAAGLAAILIVVLGCGGCAKRSPVAGARPAKATLVSVSLDRLAPRHALYPDLARLDAAVQRLERPVRGGAAEPAAGRIVLGGLPALTLPAADKAASSNSAPLGRLRTLGSAQRSALAVRLEALNAAETRRRRQSLIAGRRAFQIEGRAQRMAEAEAAYRRQLESALSGGYVDGHANLRIDIAALESAVQASIVPKHREYFEERLAAAQKALTALKEDEQKAQREAGETAEKVLDAADDSDDRAIEATLRREREQANRRTRMRLVAEERAFDEDIAAIREQLAALARSGGSNSAPPLRAQALPAHVLPAQAAGVTAKGGAVAAARSKTLAHVRAQRDRLRAVLFADLRARVRAAAQARNLLVTFDDANTGGRAAAPNDRTSDFSSWLDAQGGKSAAAS